VYTVSQKTCHYIFDDNLNRSSPIITLTVLGAHILFTLQVIDISYFVQLSYFEKMLNPKII